MIPDRFNVSRTNRQCPHLKTERGSVTRRDVEKRAAAFGHDALTFHIAAAHRAARRNQDTAEKPPPENTCKNNFTFASASIQISGVFYEEIGDIGECQW